MSFDSQLVLGEKDVMELHTGSAKRYIRAKFVASSSAASGKIDAFLETSDLPDGPWQPSGLPPGLSLTHRDSPPKLYINDRMLSELAKISRIFEQNIFYGTPIVPTSRLDIPIEGWRNRVSDVRTDDGMMYFEPTPVEHEGPFPGQTLGG